MSVLIGDVRYAWRSLAAHRGYAVAAILTFAIGIGANVSVFNLANWLLLRPLPGVTDPSRLVSIRLISTEGFRNSIPFVDTETLGAGTPALAGLAGYQTVQAYISVSGADPSRASLDVVSGDYFHVLGMPMERGRGFSTAEGTEPGLPPVAVISDRLWRRDFHGDPNVLGRTVSINRAAVAIVGVATRGFQGASLIASSDVWMPVAQFRIAMPGRPATLLTSRDVTAFSGLIGKLAPGASQVSAETQMESVRMRLAQTHPTGGGIDSSRMHYRAVAGVEAYQAQRTQLTSSLSTVLAIAALLLVLTCANVGNLMVARGLARRGEIATRLAIGASRIAVARLLLVESLLLAVSACTAAVGLSWLIAAALEGTVVLQGLAPLEHAEMDWRVLGYAMLLSTIVATAAGVFPALAGARLNVNAALREAGRSLAPGRRHLRRAMTMAQVAVSLTLVVGAGLLVRSMQARLAINPGFDAARVVTFSIDPKMQRDGGRPTPFLRDLLDRVRQVPGVRAAALASLRPSFQGVNSEVDFFAEDTNGIPMLTASTVGVSAGYFDALGMPVIEGREFALAETQTTSPLSGGIAIMTASLARRTFGGASAVGRRIEWAGRTGPMTVIGVVGDTRQRRLTDSSPDMIFLPLHDDSRGAVSVIVGLSDPRTAVIPGLRHALSSLDPALPMYDVMRVDEGIRGEFADDYLVMRLTLAFAVLATLVAAVGLFGVLARGVAERRREFGIRVALGANGTAVAALVTREAVLMLCGGVVIGVAASLALARVLDNRLFGVTHFDMLSFAGAIGLVTLVMLAASAPAGRRASRIDATELMR